VKRHHTAQQGGQYKFTVFSFASLLECKQKEKICIHNNPEGGDRSGATKAGGKPLENRLITGLEQGRQACQPRSVPG
jgi:hypothetical protein